MSCIDFRNQNQNGHVLVARWMHQQLEQPLGYGPAGYENFAWGDKRAKSQECKGVDGIHSNSVTNITSSSDWILRFVFIFWLVFCADNSFFEKWSIEALMQEFLKNYPLSEKIPSISVLNFDYVRVQMWLLLILHLWSFDLFDDKKDQENKFVVF